MYCAFTSKVNDLVIAKLSNRAIEEMLNRNQLGLSGRLSFGKDIDSKK